MVADGDRIEKAVLQACEAGLSKKLVGIISGPRFQQCQQSLALIIQLLEQLVSQGTSLSVWRWCLRY